jgi:SAM-dependent methyltransferase
METSLPNPADSPQSTGAPSPSSSALGASEHAKAVAKGIAKRGIDIYFSAKCALLRSLGIIDFQVPPNHILRRTSSHTIRHYYESGLTTFMPIVTAAITFGVPMDQPINVLDFACGAGRQLLHLTRQYPNVHAYACDIRADAIAHLQRHYPKVKAYANKFDPPLPFDDTTFDLIYSVSVFSHLSIEDAQLWLPELFRIARPGSTLCLTFNSSNSLNVNLRAGHISSSVREQFQQYGFFFDSDIEGFEKKMAAEVALGFGHPGMTRPTGDMYYSTEKARSLFEGAGFLVQAILPGVIDRFQDLAVLRRPA